MHRSYDEVRNTLSSEDMFMLYKMYTEEVRVNKEMEQEVQRLKYGGR